jgi:uncharacterized membrane protein
LPAGGAIFFAVAGWMNEHLLLLLYPVLVSVAFLVVFAYGLFRPPTVVECLARRMEPHLPPEGVAYTRKVTIMWCGFFLFNALVSGVTVYSGDMAMWAIYNGFVSYLLTGAVMGAEICVRQRIKRKP